MNGKRARYLSPAKRVTALLVAAALMGLLGSTAGSAAGPDSSPGLPQAAAEENPDNPPKVEAPDDSAPNEEPDDGEEAPSEPPPDPVDSPDPAPLPDAPANPPSFTGLRPSASAERNWIRRLLAGRPYFPVRTGGTFSRSFGQLRINPLEGGFIYLHSGVDIVAPMRAEVVAAEDGTVSRRQHRARVITSS